MSHKPIFVATHPRACSTAFERVFMTRRDSLQCIHEPFGDAFYYGPERLGSRYENDEQARIGSGFSRSTYKTILERLDMESAEGKRLFIKDMAYYLIPPDGKPASIALSLARIKRGVGTSKPYTNGTDGTQEVPDLCHMETETDNPTVIPQEILKQFQFTFLIRHPRSTIPSYYRCTVPPLDKVTGWHGFLPSETGYDELRRVFDYLRSKGHVGPKVAGRGNSNGVISEQVADGHKNVGQDAAPQSVNGSQVENGDATLAGSLPELDICVVDADDLLDNPNEIIKAYCKSVGLDYDPRMLDWDGEEDHKQAQEAFKKWLGWHDDALQSSALKPRPHAKKIKSVEDEDKEWLEKYGEKGAKVIRENVNANIDDYEYLKQFALRV